MKGKLLKFGASWCTSCKSLSKVFDEMNLKDEYDIEEIDIDKNPDMAMTYGVRGLPTVVLVEDDKESLRFVGAKTPVEVRKYLDNK